MTEFSLGDINRVYSLVIASEFAWLLRSGLVTRGQGRGYNREWREGLSTAAFNEHVAKRVLPAALVDAVTDGLSYLVGRREVLELRKRFRAAFEEYDLLLTPTLRTLPPERDTVSTEESEMMSVVGNTEPLNVTGLPGVSVPAGTVDGVPVGAQVIAPWFEERRALRGARLVEQVLSKN
jgi:aspartyl-tRNA(Asn)/glutamyl-tRNA(Gln) amidotransferase subunit A